jgi:hypothetical protein
VRSKEKAAGIEVMRCGLSNNCWRWLLDGRHTTPWVGVQAGFDHIDDGNHQVIHTEKSPMFIFEAGPS